MPHELPLLQGKITAPTLPTPLVVRERLTASIQRRLAALPVLVVCAAAGAGKTAAVRAALQGEERLGWLSLDDADSAPGRLLTYLAASLARIDDSLPELARSTLAANVPHTEVAGLLVEKLSGQGRITIVLDQVNRIVQSRQAMGVLDSLVRFLPPEMRLVLISRTAFTLPSGSDAGMERIDYVIDQELAFTEAETSEALQLVGDLTNDPATVQKETGGWVIGVLFAGTRSPSTLFSLQPEVDPLHAYLRAHVLELLREELREFVITTSILPAVDAERAEALGIERSEALLTELRAHRLPMVWEPGGKVVRYHPVLKDYLLILFGRRPNSEVFELRTRFARLLIDEGFMIEATEELLSIGAYSEALPLAEAAIFTLIDRRDYDVADRWLDRLASHGEISISPLTTAELMLAVAREEYWRGARIADQLLALGKREELAAYSSRAATMMVWCYFHACRTDDMSRILEAAGEGPGLNAVRSLFSLVSGRLPELQLDPESTAMDGMLVRLQYWNGQLSLAARQGVSDESDALTRPWRINALRATGDLDLAHRLWQQVEAAGMLTSGVLSVVGTDLFIDLQREDEARAALERGLQESRRTGSIVWEIFGRISEAKLELRLMRNPHRALEVLREIETMPEARKYQSTSEHLDTWFGYAHLLLDDAESAYASLSRAIELMQQSGRMLELPTAAVYLAEASWRTGDEEGADRLLDLAREAARSQQTDEVLVRALREFPSVLSRKLDGFEHPEAFWVQLGKRVLAPGSRLPANSRLRISVREFGTPVILVDGSPVRPRIAKCTELLSYLATTPDLAAGREELLDALFDGRNTDSSRSYLRQVVHQLRAVLPEGVGPTLVDGRVAFTGQVELESAADQLLRIRQHPRSNQPRERLEEIEKALSVVQGNEFLPKSTTAWVEERRAMIATAISDLRLEAAHIAFELTQYSLAASLSEQVVDEDPLRESAWQLRMRASALLGSFDDVLALYAECAEALQSIQTKPAYETRALLEQLRR